MELVLTEQIQTKNKHHVLHSLFLWKQTLDKERNQLLPVTMLLYVNGLYRDKTNLGFVREEGPKGGVLSSALHTCAYHDS